MIEPRLNVWFVHGPPVEICVARCDPAAETHPGVLFNIRPLGVGVRLLDPDACELQEGDFVEVSASHPQTEETLLVLGIVRRRGRGLHSGFLSIVFSGGLTPDPFPRETLVEELNRFHAEGSRGV